jgi:hypothetical protein
MEAFSLYSRPMAPAVSRKSRHPFSLAWGTKFVVVQHRRDDARGTIGGRGDDAAAGCVLLVDRHGVDVDEIQDGELVAQGPLGLGAECAVQFGGAALDQQVAGQAAFGADAALHTGAHRLPDAVQPGIHLGVGAPGLFVGPHHLGDGQAGDRRHWRRGI